MELSLNLILDAEQWLSSQQRFGMFAFDPKHATYMNDDKQNSRMFHMRWAANDIRRFCKVHMTPVHMCVCVCDGPFNENEISRNDEIRASCIAVGASSVTFLTWISLIDGYIVI